MGAFVTLAAKTRYLKGISALAAVGSEQTGITQVELTDAEYSAEAWVRHRLGDRFTTTAWTTPATTPSQVRHAADMYGSGIVLWWLAKRQKDEFDIKLEAKGLFKEAEELIKTLRDAPALYLDSGTAVARKTTVRMAPVYKRRRPAYPAEALQVDRQTHGLPGEQEAALSEAETGSDFWTT